MLPDVIPALRAAGFKVRGSARARRDDSIDAVAEHDGVRYGVQLKDLRDVRADQVTGTIADAYLRMHRALAEKGMVPLIVLRAPRWTTSMLALVASYRDHYLSDASVLLLEHSGNFHLVKEGENRSDSSAQPIRKPRRGDYPVGSLFTDRTQWLLKVLVKNAWRLDDGCVTGPVGPFSTHVELARAAGISISRVWSFYVLLTREGFRARTPELVRIDELLDRWRAIRQLRRVVDVGWVIPTDHPTKRLDGLLAGRAEWEQLGPDANGGSAIRWRGPRACLAGLSAADALGHGFVSGGIPELYVDHVDEETLKALQVRPVEPGQAPDLRLVQPRFPESVFRACVPGLHGTPTADVIQTWIDVIDRPERGHEQAEVLRRKVLHAPR